MRLLDFLSLEDVLALHDEQVAAFGGAGGVRDAGSLESAVETPRATFGGALLHTEIFSMAAAYAFHIAQNQPFVDGNKRTGLAAALVFLDLNGFEVRDQESAMYNAMIGFAERTLDKAGLAEIFRRLASPTA